LEWQSGKAIEKGIVDYRLKKMRCCLRSKQSVTDFIYSDGQQSKGRLKNRFSDGLYLPDGG
jgi:hypothetical protein